jgi:TonB family protein
MADAQTRHGRGLLVVAALAVIFFALLGLILVRKGGQETERAKTAETLTVLPVRIRIRTEPNARAPVVATANNGEHVTLLEDRGTWVRVQTTEGLAGWAERANLERTAEQERRTKRWEAIKHLPPLKGSATDRVQLYAGPGIFYPLVGALNEGTDVTVYTRDHDFYAVANGNGIAYADVDAIDISAPTSRQVDVGSAGEPPAEAATDTATVPPAVAETETAEPLPVEVQPPSEPAPAEPSGGIYSAVPPGGTQPQEIDRVIPRYPAAARRANIQGSAVVRGIVRRDGTIDNVEVIQDLPQGLGEEARRAVSRWRFRPATFRGEPIDVYYTVTVNFRLQ